MNMLVRLDIFLLILPLCAGVMADESKPAAASQANATAIFAGGCF
jgi:hypothetical protein